MNRETRTQVPFRTLFALAALPLAFSCATALDEVSTEEVADLVREGKYERALARAEALAKTSPSDRTLQDLHRDVRVHEMLYRTRRLVFEGEEEEGLAILEEAIDLDPQNGVVFSWIQKIRIQLAEDWLNRAAEMRNRDRLDEARDAYENALAYVPATGERAALILNEAKLGLARVLLLQNYREGLSKTMFQDGIRSFQNYLLHQAGHSFGGAEHYDPNNERARVRGDQVDELLAEERLALARSFEADRLFFAARNEYRLVLLVNPDSVEAREGLDRMDREARATQTIGEADMQIRRGNLEAAGELLAETQGFTEAQSEAIQRLEGQIEDRGLELMYLTARNYENDFRYHEAVASYGKLLAERPYYEDATARKATIEDYIARTEEAYEKALAATLDEEAIGYLRQIQDVYWPEYLDVPQRLAELEARVAAGASAEEEFSEEDEAAQEGGNL